MHRSVRIAAIALLALSPALHAQPTSPGTSEARYLEVPLKGGIGKEITAPGIRNALRLAQSKKATHVVFVIDTPGGRVADARAIGKVLDDEKGSLSYFVIIQRSFSAGMYLVARADRVYYTESGAAGAAVSFSTDVETGNAQVDAKMNAAWCADLATTAEAHGQCGAAYRAMVIQDACLYSTKDKKGKATLTDQRPSSGEFDTLDTAATVFAPTAKQACEIGMGNMLKSASAALIGEDLGTPWTAAAPAAPGPVLEGARIVETKHAETEKHRAELQRLDTLMCEVLKRYATQLKLASGADPKNYNDIYVKDGGMLTPASQMKWREKTDACLREYSVASALLDDMQQAEARFARELAALNKCFAKECEVRGYLEKAAPIDIPLPDSRVEIRDHQARIEQAKAMLVANRNRSHL